MRTPQDPFESFNMAFPRQLSYVASRTMTVHSQMRAFERRPAEFQDAQLAQQLVHLLTYARNHSPFWAERLQSWTPDDESPAAILRPVPPLLRADIQSCNKRLQTRIPNRAALRPIWTTTSGSTGTPVRVEHLQKLYGPVYFAVNLLSEAWYGFDPCRPTGTLGSKYSDHDQVPLAAPFRWLGPTAAGFIASSRTRQIPELYEYCARRQPSYLHCGPGLAFELARYAQKTGRRDLQCEMVLSLGSAVTGEMRETVREGLGARVIDRYSCEETGYIALQCPKHDHLHVITPMTYVEIVDEAGKPCPPGRPGRVLLTAMQSYGMPLIRYDIGDVAEWGDPCDCGIALPVLKQIWGRTRHLLTHPDGSQNFVRIYARNFDDVPGLESYRFVLHQNSVIAAQIRSSAPSAQSDVLIAERIQRAVGYAYPVRIAYVDKIDWGSSWKQENFAVSDAPPPKIA